MAERCPQCDYDLTGTVGAALGRCPECGHRLTLPTSPARDRRLTALRPDEARFSGRRLVVVLLILMVATVVFTMAWGVGLTPFPIDGWID